MSVHECINIGHPIDIDAYIQILRDEYGARANPHQPGTYLIDDPPTPFYKPELFEGRMFVLGFSYVPLSEQIVIALLDHPELAPDGTWVHWTSEQELLLRSTLSEIKAKLVRETKEGIVGTERRA